jgi:hypothetical protein
VYFPVQPHLHKVSVADAGPHQGNTPGTGTYYKQKARGKQCASTMTLSRLPWKSLFCAIFGEVIACQNKLRVTYVS